MNIKFNLFLFANYCNDCYGSQLLLNSRVDDSRLFLFIFVNMEQKIQDKWKDPNFALAFSSLSNFYQGLKQLPEFRNVTLAQVKNALEKKDYYLYQLSGWKNHFDTRHLTFAEPEFNAKKHQFTSNPVPGMGIEFQADTFYMSLDEKHQEYFLLLVDCWDDYLYGKPLSDRSAQQTIAALHDIIIDNNLIKFSTLTTDAGTEFKTVEQDLHGLDPEVPIKHFIFTQSAHKAFLAEV